MESLKEIKQQQKDIVIFVDRPNKIMAMENKIKLFEDRRIRYACDAEREEWFFSAVDVCFALADSASKDPGAYWRKLKQRLINEGSEVVTNCHGLKLPATDGKS